MLAGDKINRKGLKQAAGYFNEAVDTKYHIEEIEMITKQDVEKLRDDFVAAVEKSHEEDAQFQYRQSTKALHVVSTYETITKKPFPMGKSKED